MFSESQDLMFFVAGGAFLLGWLVAKTSGFLARKFNSGKRDPRDDRIRNLEAELRIARSELEKSRGQQEKQKQTLTEENHLTEKRESTIAELQEKIAELTHDLRESVKKTRELRAELSDRATENVRSEVKLREVETELSIAQASTDLIATGVLDYTVDSDDEDAPPTTMTAAT